MSTANVSMDGNKSALKRMGSWSFFGIVALLLVFTLTGGVQYGNLLKNIADFLTGNLAAVPKGTQEPMLISVLNIIALLLINGALAFAIGIPVNKKQKSHNMAALQALLDKGPMPLFTVVFFEELMARGLFLGLGTLIFKGDIAFYILFFLGNAIWALIHLTNYTDEKERSILKVIPQFISGLVFTYIFVRYGFFVAILSHFLFNVILMSTSKETMPDRTTVFGLLYYGGIGLILLLVANGQEINLGQIEPWLTNKLVPLDSFGFAQYAVILLLVECATGVLVNVLLLDKMILSKETEEITSSAWMIIFASLIHIGIILVGNWLLSLIFSDLVTRATVIAVFLCLTTSSYSGSSLTRVCLANIPSTFLVVVATTVLGFWYALGLIMLIVAVGFVPLFVESKMKSAMQ